MRGVVHRGGRRGDVQEVRAVDVLQGDGLSVVRAGADAVPEGEVSQEGEEENQEKADT